MKSPIGILITILSMGSLLLVPAAFAGSPAPAPASDDYVLGAGDQIEVTVFGEPDLSRTVMIKPDGVIALPLVNQVKASGKTAAQLEVELRRLYAKYLKSPTISIVVRQFQMKHVYVMGEVTRPGRYDLTDDMTFLDALTLAGGATDKGNLDAAQIARTENGKSKAISIKAKQMLQGKEVTAQNVKLQSGDLIYIPRRGLGLMDVLNNIGLLRMVLGL